MPNWVGADALYALKRLGQAGHINLCLDAGAAASYPGSGQVWTDLSGNSPSGFNLGATSSAAGDDPTFNGVAGAASGNEYFGLDGGDLFKYAAANEAWMNAQHKDNAAFTWLIWAYIASLGSAQGLLGTNNNGGLASTGIRLSLTTGGAMTLNVTNGGGAAVSLSQSGGAGKTVTGAWNFYAVSVDEANNKGQIVVNASITADFAAAYASPSAAAASNTLVLGAATASPGAPLLSGARMRMVNALDKPLTVGEIMAFREATRGSFAA